MKIKEIEKLTGIKSTNIRFYEREGLLTPNRAGNNYRSYTEEDIKTLEQIKTLRLLGVPIEDIKQLIKGENTLNSVLMHRLHQIEANEKNILEQKKICQRILNDKLQIEDINTDLLTDNQEFWHNKWEKILREDIDSIFLIKGIFMLIAVAIFIYLALWVMTNPDYALINLPQVIKSTTDIIQLKVTIGIGIFFIVYGIVWAIIEGYNNFGLMWVSSAGKNWASPGMGALTNSYTLCGLGCAIISIASRAWIAGISTLTILCIGCILILTLIRGVFMWMRSKNIHIKNL